MLIHQCLAEYSACAMQAGSVQPGLQLSGSGLSSNTHMGLLGLFVYILMDVVAPCSCPGNQSRFHPDKLFGTGIAKVSKTLD